MNNENKANVIYEMKETLMENMRKQLKEELRNELLGEEPKEHQMIVFESGGVKLNVVVDRIVSVEYVTQADPITKPDIDNAKNSKHIKHTSKQDKQDSPLFIIKPESLFVDNSAV